MEYTQYPQLEKVRLLWHNDYWDLPLNGVCEYDGRKYWFQQCDGGRRYIVQQLSAEELTDELDVHELFRTHVGHHTDYNEEGKRTLGCHEDTNSDLFYDAYEKRPPRDYRNNKIIGWFQR
jgi:hypothetical protein